jgi:hypothetical protein
MCLSSLLWQGILTVWSVSAVVIVTAIAFVYARIAIIKLWQARPTSSWRAGRRLPAAAPRSGPA